MNTKTLSYICLIIFANAMLLQPRHVIAGVEDLSVVELVDENVLVRGRTAYYTYSLRITNDSTPLTNVSAVVSSQSREIRVTDRNLQFGDVGTNAQVQSTDTFTFRLSASATPNLSHLIYTFSGQEAVIDEDVVPPTITAQLSSQPNENGWHNAPVTVSFACSDDIAVESCSGDTLVDIDGENQIIIGTATDSSGNSVSTQVSINLDTQAPNVQASLSVNSDTLPADNATLLQKISINTLSEADSQLTIYRLSNDQNTLLDGYSSDSNGEGRVQNINLPLGVSDFRVESLDAANNQGETTLSIERLQCRATSPSRSFYIDSPLVMNAELSALYPGELAFSGIYHQFKGDAEGLITVIPGFINDDVLLDWVMVDGNASGVTVLINDGSGRYTGGIIKNTGFSMPVDAVLSNLVEGEALDLAVAHQDGVVAIYAGNGDGSFSNQPSEVFVFTEPVVELISGDINHDGFTDLLVLTPTKLESLIRNNAQSIAPVITNGNFANGLAGWMANATGHTSAQSAGGVMRSSNGAQLFEKGSFLVSLFQSFTPPANATTLSFTISSLFLEMSDGAIPDVLEVSLLNASNQSLVPTFHPNATSFLNIAADGTVKTASGVDYNNGQVNVDISTVTDEAILFFDLVGHPPEQGSTFVVSNVDAGESTIVDNSYTSSMISHQLTAANGMEYCDALGNAPPIIVSDPGEEHIVIYQDNGSGVFAVTSTLAQGGL